MNIFECQYKAQELSYDKSTFDLVGQGRRIKCKWLDAYMGIFQIDGNDGFCMMRDVPSDFTCENLTVEE